jgi:hypothetical protein
MNNLNNQSTNLIGDCYKKYYTEWSKSVPGDGTFSSNEYSSPSKYEACNFTKEEFINKIKTDDEFAKKWGVKVEVRELSLDERYVLANINGSKEKLPGEPNYTEEQQHSMLDELVPTKAISLTYDNKTIENYE